MNTENIFVDTTVPRYCRDFSNIYTETRAAYKKIDNVMGRVVLLEELTYHPHSHCLSWHLENSTINASYNDTCVLPGRILDKRNKDNIVKSAESLSSAAVSILNHAETKITFSYPTISGESFAILEKAPEVTLKMSLSPMDSDTELTHVFIVTGTSTDDVLAMVIGTKADIERFFSKESLDLTRAKVVDRATFSNYIAAYRI